MLSHKVNEVINAPSVPLLDFRTRRAEAAKRLQSGRVSALLLAMQETSIGSGVVENLELNSSTPCVPRSKILRLVVSEVQIKQPQTFGPHGTRYTDVKKAIWASGNLHSAVSRK